MVTDLEAVAKWCAERKQHARYLTAADLEMLDEAAAAIRAAMGENAALHDALKKLHHAVCGDSGFASAVRAHSGVPYPWPALDIAEEAAVAALAQVRP
jgi:hypothetical protein